MWTPYRLRRLKQRKTDGSSRMTSTESRSVNGRFGDVEGGNYVKIDANGIQHYGTAMHWDDIRVKANAVRTGASGAPDWVEFPASSGLYTYQFAGVTTVEQVFFNIQLPHGYSPGTDLECHVHYCSTDNAGTGYVKFSLDYVASSIDSVFDASPTTISGTDAIDVGDIRKHRVCELGVVDGTGLIESAMLICRLYRDPTDVEDTFAYDAAFLEADFHYQIEKPGTNDEYPT